MRAWRKSPPSTVLAATKCRIIHVLSVETTVQFNTIYCRQPVVDVRFFVRKAMKDRWPGDSPIPWYRLLGGEAPAFLLSLGSLPVNSSIGYLVAEQPHLKPMN